MSAAPIRILYFGTPEFAVASLDILFRNNYQIVGIVTAPDKPAGRGLELKRSAVKEYAMQKNLTVLQPENLKSPEFMEQIRALKPDLGIVVAFRKLPREVWSMPALGTFNLHGSLLPHYRGAAPINWAIINGEKESGVTTFFLNDEIDTGKIIMRAKEPIFEEDTVADLYGRLMKDGADLVLKTVRAIESGNYSQEDQSKFLQPGEKPKLAPKIFKETCRIDWNQSAETVYNFIRGLSPVPTAWTDLRKDQETISMKIYKATKEMLTPSESPGTLLSDGRSYVKVAVKDGYVHLAELQLAGRKRMSVIELLRGFSFTGWSLV